MLAYSDINFVERNGFEDCQFAALHVQGEVVDGGVIEGHQDRVEWKAADVNLKKIIRYYPERRELKINPMRLVIFVVKLVLGLRHHLKVIKVIDCIPG